ncbi:cell division protein FtsQ/DivIB [Roseofilum casamattae]|uniref:FtsQ-type POTRA domain-containing protein n=1 Tax=Roseofilum casamattae BLCC-M143 TaxID=3022442 RepID=A0ABT7BYS2_9CYAN|nr:FtsQ-type POTRA domain-containing protein [Roseofilum casamattae]MDJ1184306.1 FtsQ-type POTRA domain-containing protein [Roseofilum casamattae BLCC-M143]
MTIIQPISRQELARRRQRLRRQQRLKVLQTLWQTLAVGAIAYGGGWLISQPNWTIREPEQAIITGNQLVKTEALRSLLPIDYPQSLFRVEPDQIAMALESKGPIAKATVTRQLFPLGLTIAVIERLPVAIALSSENNESHTGLIDEQGIWMPMENYTSLTSFPLPTLKIIGDRRYYQEHWPEVYRALSSSPAEVLEINWQNPRNIILTTEVGPVHLGPYTSDFPRQLEVLDRMRKLPQQLDPSAMDYIDLSNPDSPYIQMNHQ